MTNPLLAVPPEVAAPDVDPDHGVALLLPTEPGHQDLPGPGHQAGLQLQVPGLDGGQQGKHERPVGFLRQEV